MGVIKYGFGIDQIIGKVGNGVFQVSGKSPAVRIYKSHPSPKSFSSQVSRSQFGIIANAWQALTPANKADWHTKASTYPHHNKYGVSTLMTNYQLFQHINRMNLTGSRPVVTVATNYSVPPLYTCGLNNLSVGGHTCQFTKADNTVRGNFFLLFLSLPFFDAGQDLNFKTRFCNVWGDSLSNGTNMYTPINNMLSQFIEVGKSSLFEFYTLSVSTGQWVLDGTGSFDFVA